MRKFKNGSSASIPENWNLEAGVSFAPTADIVIIPSLDDYTEEEIQSIWFTSEEYQDFLVVAERTIEKMMRGRPLRGKYCFRGLETMVEDNYEVKGERQAEAFHAVFNEQRAQHERGEDYYNPEAIAKSYTQRTKDSQMAAQLAAHEDEYEVDVNMECDVFVAQVLHQMAFQHWIEKIMEEEPAESKSSILEILDETESMLHPGEESKEDQSAGSSIEKQDYSAFLKAPLREASDASLLSHRGLVRRISLRNLIKQDSLKNIMNREARKQPLC